METWSAGRFHRLVEAQHAVQRVNRRAAIVEGRGGEDGVVMTEPDRALLDDGARDLLLAMEALVPGTLAAGRRALDVETDDPDVEAALVEALERARSWLDRARSPVAEGG